MVAGGKPAEALSEVEGAKVGATPGPERQKGHRALGSLGGRAETRTKRITLAMGIIGLWYAPMLGLL